MPAKAEERRTLGEGDALAQHRYGTTAKPEAKRYQIGRQLKSSLILPGQGCKCTPATFAGNLCRPAEGPAVETLEVLARRIPISFGIRLRD